jgi:hypothetical protein
MATNGSRPYVVTDLPEAARPWSDIVTRVYGRITEARVFLVAAGVTCYALLAIFPAIVALISWYSANFGRNKGTYGSLGTVIAHDLGFPPPVLVGAAIDAETERQVSAAKALVTNARCLTEGIDVPEIDMVAFIDPRRSRVDIAASDGSRNAKTARKLDTS